MRVGKRMLGLVGLLGQELGPRSICVGLSVFTVRRMSIALITRLPAATW